MKDKINGLTTLRLYTVRAIYAALLSLLAPAMVAKAQLYQKAAPPGSTFVRIFNGTAVSGVDGFIGDHRQSSMAPYTGNDFIFLPPSDVKVSIGNHSETYKLEADHFYSVVETVDGLKLFDLHGFTSQIKAMVVMFNLMSEATLSLKSADGKAAIFDSLGPYKGAQREVNPVTVPLALYMGDKKILDLPAQAFERGKVSSLIVAGSMTSPIVSWGDGQ